MVGRLAARFDLAQLNGSVARGGTQHFPKQLVAHKMRARAGGKVAAAREQLHGAIIDFLIAARCLGHISFGFGKSRGIENNQIEVFCNAFAYLVESGSWNTDQAYTWDGTNLK